MLFTILRLIIVRRKVLVAEVFKLTCIVMLGHVTAIEIGTTLRSLLLILAHHLCEFL